MYLKKNKKNKHLLHIVFAIAITVLWLGANSSMTNAQVVRGTLFDFTGNGRTDFTTTAAASGQTTWRIAGNPATPGPNNAFIRIFNYGLSTDIRVPQDYTGDRKTEVTVYRRATGQGTFYVAQFPTGPEGITLERAVPFGDGTTTDNPSAGGDYDGDGKIDYTIVRFNAAAGTLTWFIMGSTTNTMRAVRFGLAPDTASFVAVNGADFNADGRDELVFLSIDADGFTTWYGGDAVTGAGVFTRQFGDFNSDYVITPADYTGDRRADFVAVRQQADGQQAWYINNSATNAITVTFFGRADTTVRGDIQLRGDYDGDGRQDIAVWRRTDLTFYWINSSNGSIQSQQWGVTGDNPLATLGVF